MRKRINRNAVCSSENYSASKRVHADFLKEKHDHFCGLMISGEIKFDVPVVTPEGSFEPKFRTITIWGKQMTLTIEEFKTHYTKCNF